jgi:chitin-binding protein
MRARRAAIAAVLLSLAPALAVVAFTGEAASHGTMTSPVSRVYQCYLEGPESPDSPACKAAVATAGTQALYDWNEINIANANGQHRTIIPDGKLCSAGRSKYAGMDLGRSDWLTTTLPTSGSFTFRIRATAPHVGKWELYVTKNGYNPSIPLRWGDLETTPFLTKVNPTVTDGYYSLTGNLPSGRTGRHLIYMIWQRSDSTEAFYSCSDVVFGSAPTPTPTTSPTASPSPSPTPSPTTSPTATPSPTATGTYPAWAANTSYAVGARVSYGGKNYSCRQAHTSLPGWEPPAAPALWLQL